MKLIDNLIVWVITFIIVYTIHTYVTPIQPMFTLAIGYTIGQLVVILSRLEIRRTGK